MSFNYSQDQIEEILWAIYAEIWELREISAKGMMYRDHYWEGAVSDLVEKGIRQTNEGELEQVLHDYSVFWTDYKGNLIVFLYKLLNFNNILLKV